VRVKRGNYSTVYPRARKYFPKKIQSDVFIRSIFDPYFGCSSVILKIYTNNMVMIIKMIEIEG